MTTIDESDAHLAPAEPPPAKVLHFSPAERAARGRAARAETPRTSQAEVDGAPARDPVAILDAVSPQRVPELVPIRYGRMLVSPFTFYRGAAAVMAHDLEPTPRSGLQVQLCGDAHLLNFGGFASPERDLVFDLNDFDETLAGPFEWDVKRLAASVEVAVRDRGLADQGRTAAVLGTARAYRETMSQLATSGTLDAWYAHVDVSDLVDELAARHDRRGVQTVERAEAHAY